MDVCAMLKFKKKIPKFFFIVAKAWTGVKKAFGVGEPLGKFFFGIFAPAAVLIGRI